MNFPFFDGRQPLTSRVMRRLLEHARIRAGLGGLAASGELAVQSTPGGRHIHAGLSLTGGLTDEQILASRLAGNIFDPFFLMGLGMGQTNTSYPPGSSSGFVSAYQLEIGYDPYLAEQALVTKLLDASEGVTPEHDDYFQDGSVSGATALAGGMYSLPGAWLSGARRARSARGFYVYHQGAVAGGTYRLAHLGNWTPPLSYAATAAAVQAALEALPSIGAGNVAVEKTYAGGGNPLPLLIVFKNALASTLPAAPAFSVDSQVTGSADALGRSPLVACAAVTIPRSPGGVYYDVTSAGFSTAGVYGGTMTFTWRGQTTAGVSPFCTAGLTAAAIRADLEALSNVGAGNVAVYPTAYANQVSAGAFTANVWTTGFRVAFLGDLEDVSCYSPLRLNTGAVTGSPVPASYDISPALDYWRSVANAEYYTDARSSGAAQLYPTRSLLSLSGGAVWVYLISAAAGVKKYVPLEYGFPGEFFAYGAAPPSQGNPTFVLSARAAYKTGISISSGFHFEANSADALLSPYSPSQDANCVSTDGMLIDIPEAGGPAMGTGTQLHFYRQRPAMELFKLTQPVVIADRAGRPIGMADGYLIRPRDGDPTFDSAHGTRAYRAARLASDIAVYKASASASTAPALYYQLSAGGTQVTVGTGMPPSSLFRVGGTPVGEAGVCFRAGPPAALPWVRPVRRTEVGASVTQAESLTGEQIPAYDKYIDTITWADDGFRASQDRTISSVGLGAVGQVAHGAMLTGPALGVERSRSQQRTSVGHPESAPGEFWYSECYANTQGRIAYWRRDIAPGSAGTKQLNMPFPARLILRAAGVSSDPDHSDSCLYAALSALGGGVTLTTDGVDIAGAIGYGDAPENNPAPAAGTKAASFGFGLCWSGNAGACGGTVYFLLTIADESFLRWAGAGLTTLSVATNGSPTYAGSGPKRLVCRLFVYWNATPTVPPPHLLGIGGAGPATIAGLYTPSSDAPPDSETNLRLWSPGLVGVSNYSHLQRPLEGTALNGTWSFRAMIGAAGEPPGVREGLDVTIEAAPQAAWTYAPAQAGTGCDFTAIRYDQYATDGPYYVYCQAMLGRCCATASLKLTLADSSAGVYGSSNLFPLFVTASGLAASGRMTHLFVWILTGKNVGPYIAALMPDADGGFSIVFARYTPDGIGNPPGFGGPTTDRVYDFGGGGLSPYVPLNDREPGTGWMTGPLSWNGNCTTFIASGTVYLDEPGVGKAKIDVYVST